MARKAPLRFNSDHQKDLATLLRGLSHRHNLWQVWRDFVECSALAISNAVDHGQAKAREAQYMQTISRYSADEAQQLSQALAHVVMGLEAGHADFLGSLFMQLELGNSWTGQFFTPYEVARLMGQMTLHDAREKLQAEGFITVSDPCVGGGAMVIAAAHALLDMGINYQRCMHVTAQDIDLTAVHMAYVQMSLLHIPGVVIHGNSLAVEERSHWFTPAHVMGGWGARLERRGRQAGGFEVPELLDIAAQAGAAISPAEISQAEQGAAEVPTGEGAAGEQDLQAPEPTYTLGQQAFLF